MRITIKIKLAEIKDPEIWRILHVPIDITFHKLHRYIQAAMGWQSYHLYEFKENPESSYFKIISPLAEDLPGIDGRKANAANILMAYLDNRFLAAETTVPLNKIYYVYDYGDHWEHEIEVLEWNESKEKYAEVIDGAGNCPPEDCGGVDGYQRIKDYLSGKLLAEEYYNFYSAQDIEAYNIDQFDIAKANARIRKVR